jgi:hypothetical protein
MATAARAYAASASDAPPPWTTPAALEAVRPQVRELLTTIPVFAALSAEEQRALAANMVKVMAYIADPNGVVTDAGAAPVAAAQAAPARPPLARAQDGAVDRMNAVADSSPGQVEFQANAGREGVKLFGEMVQKVDFPKFVGGLIKNVFQAIVESSIEQMRAYGELVANVAKTVDDFAKDNISESAGRDWLSEKYPDTFEVASGAQSQGFAEGDAAPAPAVLTAVGENPEVRLAEISRDLGIPPITDISDPQAELKIVTAARLQMAKSRQQMLASMVMLGINRIVVTDGSINAKVIFDMRATDKAKRKFSAQMSDQSTMKNKNTVNASYGGWMSPVDVDVQNTNEMEHVATVGSAIDETSESKAEVKAKLSGEVRVNFKSDYLPMDKMATPEMMATIQGNATPYNPNLKATTP